MIYAIQDEQRTIATPGARGTCPSCDAPVIAKCGKLISWHWAHVHAECDPFSEPMTQWHIDWQNRFPAEWQEVVIKRDGQTHRADVQLPSGKVIEFQHSPISVEDIAAREAFYGDMVWVFDCRGAYENDRFEIKSKETHETFRWKSPRISAAYTNAPVFLDLGVGGLFSLKRIYVPAPFYGWGHLVTTKKDAGFPHSWLIQEMKLNAEIEKRKREYRAARNRAEEQKSFAWQVFCENPSSEQERLDYVRAEVALKAIIDNEIAEAHL